ncbi:MAG: ribonuclease PH [Verrucomicrobiia bacterium]
MMARCAIMARTDGRELGQIRPTTMECGIAPHAAGSVLIRTGNTQVICAAMIEENIPGWMKEQRVSGGWLTAEYSMLPYSTLTRKPRDGARGRIDGRSVEIQRLIGRALRAVVDLEALGPRTLAVDCDVLQADGGTRTASINGAWVACALAAKRLVKEGILKKMPLKGHVAAISAGVVEGEPMVDLCYVEDKEAAVDLNLVMTDAGAFVEIQGSGEESTFSRPEMERMLELGSKAILDVLIPLQQEVLNTAD